MYTAAFRRCVASRQVILMEGALSERLKREYHLTLDPHVTMARLYRDRVQAAALSSIWNQYIAIARRYGFPFLAATPTRRTNRETIALAGCGDSVIEGNVSLLQSVREQSGIEMYVGGQMGNRGNAYTLDGALSRQEAYDFHSWTVERYQKAGVDFLYPSLIPSLPEALGIAQAIDPTGLPYILSFTIQGDGRLIDGTTIADAIETIDSQTVNKPVCYMTNCVHPRFVLQALTQPFNQTPLVHSRFAGIQANAAALTYKEMDDSPVLLTSAPEELAVETLRLADLDQIRIWGGCCGTNDRHMEQIAKALLERFPHTSSIQTKGDTP